MESNEWVKVITRFVSGFRVICNEGCSMGFYGVKGVLSKSYFKNFMIDCATIGLHIVGHLSKIGSI